MPGPESEPIVSKVEDTAPTVEQAPQEQAAEDLEARSRIAPENPALLEKDGDDYGTRMWKAEQRSREVTDFHKNRIAALADEAGRLAHALSGTKEPYVPQPPVEIDTSVGKKPNWTALDELGADLAHKAYMARVSAAGYAKPGDRSYDDLYPKAS